VTIAYDRFARVVTRCIEIANETDANPVVVGVFKETFEKPATAYLATDTAISTAMTAFAKENREALAALALPRRALSRMARAAISAVLPGTDLPDTLKSLPTDTDQLNAITRMVDVIDDHIGKAWADALLTGEFGTKAPKTIQELEQSIAANKGLSKAKNDRAAAYGPTYELYLAFKRVVRNAYGPGSKQYRRIHLRASPGEGTEGT
jgi:ribonuclease D